MKFSIPVQQDNLGGTIWLRHIGETLKQLGHDVTYCSYEDSTSSADYVIIQSEWIEKPSYLTSKKAIVLLGHFTKTVYPDPYKIRPTDIILTQWKGPVIEKFEKESGLKTHYFPHGYFPEELNTTMFEQVSYWVGTETPFRDTSRFTGLPITRIEHCFPNFVGGYYAQSKICPNVHLNIQKGQMVNVPESVIDTQGYAVNERLFWIPGAGGFQLADENPIIREFYDEDEVPMATAEEFKEKFEYYLNHPEERERMAKKAHERTMNEHLYEHRIKQIMLPLL